MQNRSLIVLILGLCLACCLLVFCCLVFITFGYLYLIPASRSTPEPSSTPPAAASQPALAPDNAPAAACPSAMQQVLETVEASTYGPDPGISGDLDGELLDPDSIYLVTYPVQGDVLGSPVYEQVSQDLESMQQDSEAQLAAWDLFAALVPADQKSMVSEYVIFTDGSENILAAVEQSYESPDLWSVEVDSADLDNRSELIFTLTHEFAHLLTLNAGQVTPDIEIFENPGDEDLYQRGLQACNTYFPGEGCSRPESYINAFYARFWPDIIEEWQAVDDLSGSNDVEAYYEELYSFYESHQDQFVDDYAATDPSEDIAETFAFFVFSSRPTTDSIADQKMLFFYEFPELVVLREQILQGLCEVTQ